MNGGPDIDRRGRHVTTLDPTASSSLHMRPECRLTSVTRERPWAYLVPEDQRRTMFHRPRLWRPIANSMRQAFKALCPNPCLQSARFGGASQPLNQSSTQRTRLSRQDSFDRFEE